MFGQILRPAQQPGTAYVFGKFRGERFRYWRAPLVIDNDPLHTYQCIQRWAARASYSSLTPIMNGVNGLVLRGYVQMDGYWEAPSEKGIAASGCQLIPDSSRGDQVHLWAPVIDNPSERTLHTGHVLLVVDVMFDVQRLLNNYFELDGDETLEIQIMCNMNPDESRMTLKQHERVQRFLDAAKRDAPDDPANSAVGYQHQFQRFVC